MIKQFSLLAIFILAITAGIAQPTDDVQSMHITASDFMRKGDYENAILVINRGLQVQPGDLMLTKDLVFASYLKRDFARAIEIGKPLVDRSDADVQCFQLLGMTYKALAEEKEGDKLYKKALKKYPDEGVFYSEYGDLIAEKQPSEAIKLWEKGVEVDPNHPNNYYFLAKKYAERGNTLWSMLYAETFLNMESFTARSTELKNLLLDQYKAYFYAVASNKVVAKKNDAFATAVSEVMSTQQNQLGYGINPEALTIVRTRFILDWYNKYADTYPCRLFEQHRQLLQEGMFDAYNYWLFGPAANLANYQTWQQYHQEELNTFLGFVRSKVYKIGEGQQYIPAP